MDEKRIQMAEERRLREIKLGLRLELLESIVEGMGEQLVKDLKEALLSGDKEKALTVFKKIGDTIHSRWGNDTPTKAVYDEMQGKYLNYLSSGTAGTRLMINTKSFDKFPGDLIFPNVNLNHKNNGRTLADVFEELFGDLAENIQLNSDAPYYRVKMS